MPRCISRPPRVERQPQVLAAPRHLADASAPTSVSRRRRRAASAAACRARTRGDPRARGCARQSCRRVTSTSGSSGMDRWRRGIITRRAESRPVDRTSAARRTPTLGVRTTRIVVRPRSLRCRRFAPLAPAGAALRWPLAAWRRPRLALAQPRAGAAAAAAPAVENSSLDAPLFYQLLLGEIELRNGEAGTAYQLMLDAARRTRDEAAVPPRHRHRAAGARRRPGAGGGARLARGAARVARGAALPGADPGRAQPRRRGRRAARRAAAPDAAAERCRH